MVSPQRKRFKTSQDWNDYVGTLQGVTGQELFELRKGCYQEIEKHRKRPLLVYATKFLDSMPLGAPNFGTYTIGTRNYFVA